MREEYVQVCILICLFELEGCLFTRVSHFVTPVYSLIRHFCDSISSASGWFICGLETLLLGGLCATVAYVIGQFVDGLIAKS